MTQLNFAGFSALVDALGGITVDVPKRIVDNAYPTADYGVMRIEFAQGIQRMTGDQALIYARTRHADNDFGRNQRQQQVIQAAWAVWSHQSFQPSSRDSRWYLQNYHAIK
jgi:polyisoprenyl-teichoic acid--peptidoglycan teichoic acid transferase